MGKKALRDGDAGEYRLLESLLRAKHEGAPGGDSASHELDALPLPYTATLLTPQRDGTRVVWNAFDVPRPPGLDDAVVAAQRMATAAADATAASPLLNQAKRVGSVALDRVRLCARRGVALGPKPLLVGGDGDASAVRLFAHRQLQLARPATMDYSRPPQRALIIDRGTRPVGERRGGMLRPRAFHNRPAMEAILAKYNVRG